MPIPGRPRAFDDIRRAEVFALLLQGFTVRQAAGYLGCAVRTIQREAKRDREFRRQLRSAEISARLDLLKLMRQAAKTHWRAAAWLLERTEPERYAPRPAGACGLDQFEDIAARLIELALENIDDPASRRRAYERLTSAVSDAAATLLPLPPRRIGARRAAAPLTPLLSEQRLADELEQAGRYFQTNGDGQTGVRSEAPALRLASPDAATDYRLSDADDNNDKNPDPFVDALLNKLREKLMARRQKGPPASPIFVAGNRRSESRQ